MKGKYGKVIQVGGQGKYGRVVGVDDLKSTDSILARFVGNVVDTRRAIKNKDIPRAIESGMKAQGQGVMGLLGASGNQARVAEMAMERDPLINTAEIVGSFVAPQPAVMAVGEGARSLMKGDGIPEAFKKAAAAAAVSYALGVTGKAATAALGKAGELGIRLAKRVPKAAMDQAIKDPRILTVPQKALTDVSDDVVNIAKGLKDQADDAYSLAIGGLAVKKGATVSGRAAVNAVKKLGGDPQRFAAGLMGQAKKQGVDLADDVIENYFNGGKVTFDQAKQINSLMAATIKDITKGRAAELGGGYIGRLGAAKAATMKGMETAAPGIRNLNRQYAIDRGIAEKAAAALKTESSQQTVARQLLSEGSRKVKEARAVIKLGERTGQPVVETLKNSFARQMFEQTSDNILKYRTPEVLLGASAGGAYGYRKGGALGAGLGILGGGGLALAGGQALSPEMIGKAIELAPKAANTAGLATTPAKAALIQFLLNQPKNNE